MLEGNTTEFLPWEDLIYLADLCEEANEKVMTLLGGEPTLHPHFIDFVLYLLERQFVVRVFTSGILPSKLIGELEGVAANVPYERLAFICNLNDPAESPLAEVAQVKEFLGVLGEWASPGFNIWRDSFSLDFIFQYLSAYGMRRELRLGIAHPIVGYGNQYVAPFDMPRIIERLVTYFPAFKRLRIRLGLDCGFPLCKIKTEDLGKLFALSRGELHFGCSPAIDIGPDMSVWACFPLSSFRKKSVFEFNSLNDIHTYYRDCFRDVRIEVGGIFEECDACENRESGMCSGGCLAHALNHMHGEAPVRALLYRNK